MMNKAGTAISLDTPGTRIRIQTSKPRPESKAEIHELKKPSVAHPEESSTDEGEAQEETREDSCANILMRHAPLKREKRISAPMKLDPVITNFFKAAMKDCIQSILLLRDLHGIPVDEEIELQYLPYDEKYALTAFSEHQLYSAASAMRVRKFKKEFSYILKILMLVLENFRRDSYYGILIRVLTYYELGIQEEFTLLNSRDFCHTEIRKLRKLLNSERSTLEQSIRQSREQLGNLKDELNDDLEQYNVKINFLAKWEKAREEQNQLKLAAEEKKYQNIIETNSIDIKKEKRVHNEMMNYLELSKEEYSNEIEKWMDQYDADLDNLELKTHEMKINIETQRGELEQLTELYEQRCEAMEQWNAYKMEKQREEEEFERRTRAAVKIQAWWRGTMYRKHLGPYRKKKRNRKGSSKRKSGKKRK